MEESHWSVCRCSLNPLVLEKGPVLSVLPGMPPSKTPGVFLARELTCSPVIRVEVGVGGAIVQWNGDQEKA